MRRVDLLWALGVLVLAAGYISLAVDLPMTTRRGAPGAGVFPLYIGVLLAVSGVLYLVQAVLARRRNALEDDNSSGIPTRPAMVLFGILVGYAVGLQILGFLLATFVFGFLLLSVYWRESYLKAITIPLALAVVIHLGFTVGLKLELPIGLIF